MTQWIDFHTHQSVFRPNVVGIYSLSRDEVSSGVVPERCDRFTVGVHPWWLKDQTQFLDDQILKLLKHANCFGLGEIGLDRAVAVGFELQISVFERMMNLAMQHDVERVVIHCVRAYSDVLQVLKRLKPNFKIIFHDFNANADIVDKLLAHDCYFSLGKRLFDSKSALAKSVHSIPIERVFFETDDHSDVSIEMIYDQANRVLKMKSERLVAQIEENFFKIQRRCDPCGRPQ